MATTNENLGENKTTTFHIAANDTGRSEEENPASVTENLAPPSPVNTGAGENGTETKEMEINGAEVEITSQDVGASDKKMDEDLERVSNSESVDQTSQTNSSEKLEEEIPPTEKNDSSTEILKDESPVVVPSTSDEQNSVEAQNDTKSKDTVELDENVYHIKWVNFKNQKVPIITQNVNGPCPLLAIMNVLLLKKKVALQPSTEFITANQVMTHLGNCVLENVPAEEASTALSRLNFEQNMQDAMAVMHKLQTGLDVNVRFTGVQDFEYTTECIIFDLLRISLYHGWLVDPQNVEEAEAVGKCSYNQLVEKIISNKTSDKPEEVSQGIALRSPEDCKVEAARLMADSVEPDQILHSAESDLDLLCFCDIFVTPDINDYSLIAEQFLERTASQLTYHGLYELNTHVKEDELAVFFRNNHFTTLYRNKNELFQLVTDQGFLNENNVVWETLGNVDGDCHFVDSEFHTYTKPEPPSIPVDTSNIPMNTEEQIDHDYLVALSLEHEQQMSQEQMGWGQIDPQHAPTMSDHELARQLQEEERRAAEVDAERQQQQQMMRGAGQAVGGRGGDSSQRRQRERSHGEREEKKSDCCIL